MELPHRVKSVSLGIFTVDELKALEAGGNKVCMTADDGFGPISA
jgi:hypothetical protein